VLGWGPTVRELDELGKLFSRVTHIAPLHAGPPPNSAQPYQAPNICFVPVPPAGGDTLLDKLLILKTYPKYWAVFAKSIKEADAVHVRCPANISWLALVYLLLNPSKKYRWVKYAGNWQADSVFPISYSIQRWMLQKNLHQGVVTINGRWNEQKTHILSFHNPCLEAEEVEGARHVSQMKQLAPPYRFVFVGLLTEAKGVFRVLEIIEHLHQQGLSCELHFLGDGPARSRLENLARQSVLSDKIHFHGWLPKHAITDFYRKAHFILLPSDTEGWPKVLSEGMAYGVVPIASKVSSIPQVLAETGAGFAIKPQDTDGFVARIRELIENPTLWKQMSLAGIKAASLFTYDTYAATVRKMFQTTWQVTL